MKRIGDHYVLSTTGRQFYANRGLISCVAIQGGFEIGEGYDGDVSVDDWTPEERAELADFMIAQWQAFKVQP